MKRFLSILLSVAMVMSMMPMAFAESVSEDSWDFTAETVETADEAVQGTETELADDTAEVSYSTDGGAETTSSLAGAVAAIGTGTGTIKLLKDITTAAEIKINGTITIDLDGHYISGNNDHRIFSSTGTFTLKDTSEAKTGTLKDGYVEVSGGNFGMALGAAVYAKTGSVAVIENVIFDNNKVFSSNGFSMAVFGGAVFSEYATTTISNSTFTNNVATAGGGAVGVMGGSTTINNSTFSDNYVDLYNCSYMGGGGAVWSETSKLLKISGCLFENNFLQDVHIEPTYTQTGEIDDPYPNPSMGGGAIDVQQCDDVIISDCSFTKNSAKTKKFGGGAICNYASVVKISNCRIFENTSDQYGGGVYLTNQSLAGVETTITNSYIANNEAVTAGDDIASKVNTSQKFDATYNDAYTDGTSKNYEVHYFYDGYKNGADLKSRYDPATAEEKTNIANTTEACGLKAVYTEKVATYPVTITDPIYMAATYPGGTDSKIGTITVTGASDLAAVSEGTELTLKIDIANDSKAKNHSFVKWVVKTEIGTDVTVTDNKFTMPSEAVTVTAEYVPDIQMTFYAGGTFADSKNECQDYAWNEDGTITYTMPGNKGTLTISTPNGFKLWQYIVDDETKTPTVTANDVVTVTVNTNEGYTFNGIKSVKSQMGSLTGTFSNSGTYTFSVPVGTLNNYKETQNAYIILDITKNQYNITKNYNTDEGSVQVVYRSDTSTEISKAYHGSTIWVGVEPNANYKVKSVKVKDKNNVEVTLDTTYVAKYNTWAFTMPKSDVTVSVEFELDACAITTDITHGTISGITSPVAIGSEVKFTLAPTDDTYKLDSYKVFKTGDEATTVDVTESNGTYTFTMPDYPVTVSAIFVKKTHAVTVEIQGETAGGAVSINKTSPVTVGEEVQVTVDTNAHYVLASLTMNGSPITDYKFTMPNEAVTIKAVFEKTKHALHYVESQNGTIQEITASDALPWGTVLHFTVTPNLYYVIDHVAAIINGVPTIIQPEAEGKYTYTTTPADTTIKAFYKKQQFTVKASATTNGTITLGEPATLDWDDNFTINVKADPNYEIDTVTVDGENVSVNSLGNYTFVMPTHDVTVSATFKKIKYIITGEGNNVTFGIPDKSTYNWGDTVEITATPDKWYSIKNVYAKDNSSVTVTKVDGRENTYSFVMPTGDITIVAAAERSNFTVTFDSQGGSSITPKTVANGAALTKPAAPSWAGRGFAGWYTDADCTQKYDFTAPVIGDLTLYARWFLWGDVNSDGKVNSNDALLIQRCRVGLTDYSYIKNKFAGLVSQLGDGTKYPVSRDALLIQRRRVGLITRFTVEDTAAGYEFDLEKEIIISPNA